MLNQPDKKIGISSEEAKEAAMKVKDAAKAKMDAARLKYGEKAKDMVKNNAKSIGATIMTGIAAAAVFTNPGNTVNLNKQVGEIDSAKNAAAEVVKAADKEVQISRQQLKNRTNISAIGQESFSQQAIKQMNTSDFDSRIQTKEMAVNNMRTSSFPEEQIVAKQAEITQIKGEKAEFAENIQDLGMVNNPLAKMFTEESVNELRGKENKTDIDKSSIEVGKMVVEHRSLEAKRDAANSSLTEVEIASNTPEATQVRAQATKANTDSIIAGLSGAAGAAGFMLGGQKFKLKNKDESNPEPEPEPLKKEGAEPTEFTAEEYGPKLPEGVTTEPVFEPVVEKVKAAPVKESFFKSFGKKITQGIWGLSAAAGMNVTGNQVADAIAKANMPVNIANETVLVEEADTTNPRGAPGQYLSGNKTEGGVDAKAAAEKAEHDEGAAIAREMFSKETMERKNSAETAMNNETSNLYKDSEKSKVQSAENALKDETLTMDETINNNTPLHPLKVQTTIMNAEKAGLSPEKMAILKKFLLANQGPSIGESTKALLSGAPEVKAPSIENTTPVVAEKVAQVTPTQDIASEGTPDETPAPAAEAPKVQEAISPEYAAAKIKVEQAAAETGAGAKYVEYTKKVTQELITNMSATLAEKGSTMSPQEVKVLNAKINAAKYLNLHLVDGKMYVTIAESAKATFKEAANGNPNSIFQQAADAKYGNFNLVKFGSYQFESGTMDKSGVQDFLQKYEVISRS